MSRALLDVNVLLALLDSQHVAHAIARDWFERDHQAGWASCAITQNGFVRVISQPRYPNPVSVPAAIARLREACVHPSHEFWPCDVSLTETVDSSWLLSPAQLTDVYLLALSVRREGRLVTLDRRIRLEAVPGATDDHLVVL